MTAGGGSAARVRDLFFHCLDRSPAERSDFLARACDGDAELRRRVEALLASDERAGGFLETPVLGVGARRPHVPPATVGPYRIQSVVGQGGMGVVYRATHEATGALVAVKTVAVTEAATLASLHREIVALAQVDHPGIVRVLDEGLEDRPPWYAMELVEGTSLRSLGRLAGEAPDGGRRWSADALRAVLTCVRRLCVPLAYLHGEGLVHRDLKPENVILRPSGLPCLLDFGLMARFHGALARDSLDVLPEAVGTVAYVAPEQAMGEIPDARADIYAVGCILYEILAGRLPFPGSPREALARRCREDPPPVSRHAGGLPPALDALAASMLARRPRDRAGHADDVDAALAALGADGWPGDHPTPRAYLYRPGMAGREREASSLAGMVRDLGRGGGRLALVRGVSGAGKTRLLSEVAGTAGKEGVAVVAGTCQDAPSGQGGREVPRAGALDPFRSLFAVMADRCREPGPVESDRRLIRALPVLAPFDPSLDDVRRRRGLPGAPDVPPAEAIVRVQAALAEVLAALSASRPLLLLVDDLQWADDLTATFVEGLVTSPGWRAGHTLLLGACRTGEEPAWLERVLASPATALTHVDRLDDVAVESMIAEMLALSTAPRDLVRTVTAHAEGSPLFVGEYLRAAVARGLLDREDGAWRLAGPSPDEALGVLPRSVEELLGGRLGLLPEPARDLARTASLLGREMSVEVLVAASALPAGAPSALATLRMGHVLQDGSPGRVRFTHDKLRDVARASLPEGARAAIHARAAAAIRRFEDVGSPGVLAQLAVHHREAGDAEAARECYVAAAAAARSTHAYREAERLYRELLAQPGTPPPVRVEARRALATLLTEAWGRAAEAEEQLLAALAEAPPETPAPHRAEIVRCLGLSRAHQGRPAEALASYDEALAAARDAGDRALEAQTTHNRAVVLRSMGDVAGARRCLEWALRTFRDLGLTHKVGRPLGVLAALAAEEGRLADALALYEESVAALRRTADRMGEASVSANFANLLCDGIAMQQGLAKQMEAVALHRDLGLPIHLAVSLGNLSRVELALGHEDAALDHARQALDLAITAGSHQARVSALVALGEHGLAAGDLDTAHRHLEEALHLGKGDLRLESAARLPMGRLAARRGNLDAARRWLSAASEAYAHRGIRRGEALTSLELAGVEREAGDLAEARRWLAAAESALGTGGSPLDRARCLVERARIDAGSGAPDPALLDEADALLAQAELPPGGPERRDVALLRAP